MLRNYWYIACATSQLMTQPHATRILEQDLVLFRDARGHPQALLDRCVHRGTPLSLGDVYDGQLACRYHGWRYDGTGQCVHIPSLTSQQRPPNGAVVPSWPCLERDGYIWVWMGEADAAPTSCPMIPEFPRHTWFQGSQLWHCSSLAALENNLDWCHPTFAHPGLHPQYFAVQQRGFQEQAYEMRVLPHGLVVFAPPTPSATTQPDSPIVQLRFTLPDRITLWRPADGFHLIIHFVPTSATTCRCEWLLHKPPMPEAPPVTWTETEPEIFAQDRQILEGAQRRAERYGAPFACNVPADTAPLLIRRIVDLAAQGQWEAVRPTWPSRKIVPVRA